MNRRRIDTQSTVFSLVLLAASGALTAVLLIVGVDATHAVRFGLALLAVGLVAAVGWALHRTRPGRRLRERQVRRLEAAFEWPESIDDIPTVDRGAL
jgi:hypothetical protein